MRDYDIIVPSDCVVSNTADENRYALRQMKKVLKAEITPSSKLKLTGLRQRLKQ